MSHLKSTPRLALIVTALCCVVLLASGCAKDKKTTAPAGVTGPTFSFTFPATGSSNKQTFTDVGVWGYKCIPHEAGGMVGAVKVIAGGPVDSAVVTVGPFGGFGYDPDTVTVHVGGYVRWVNVSAFTTHTVTRP